MTWTLDQAKIYLNIPGSSQDEAIQRTMDIVLSTVERFLARRLMDQIGEVLTFQRVTSSNLFLPRYPIHQVTEIELTGGTTPLPHDLIVHEKSGWIFSSEFVYQDEVKVTYDAGYDSSGVASGIPKIPPDLDHVLWEAFMYLWSTVDQTTGGPSATVSSGRDIRSVTVFDAFKVDYESAAGEGNSRALDWSWLAQWEPVLSTYQSGFAGSNVGVA